MACNAYHSWKLRLPPAAEVEGGETNTLKRTERQPESETTADTFHVAVGESVRQTADRTGLVVLARVLSLGVALSFPPFGVLSGLRPPLPSFLRRRQRKRSLT